MNVFSLYLYECSYLVFNFFIPYIIKYKQTHFPKKKKKIKCFQNVSKIVRLRQ